MLDTILNMFFGTKNKSDIAKLRRHVEKINSYEVNMKKLTSNAIGENAKKLRGMIDNGEWSSCYYILDCTSKTGVPKTTV